MAAPPPPPPPPPPRQQQQQQQQQQPPPPPPPNLMRRGRPRKLPASPRPADSLTSASPSLKRSTPHDHLPRRPCPVCRRPVAEADLETHYLWELGRISSFDHVSDAEDPTPAKGKRGAAVAARKQLASASKRRRGSVEDLDADDDERTLRAIRRNRLARQTANSQSQRPATSTASRRAASGSSEHQSCFICGASLTGMNLDEVNQHIDQCLTQDDSDQSRPSAPALNILTTTAQSDGTPRAMPGADEDGDGDDCEYEEYEWAGQTRIRVTSMLEGGAASLGHAVSSNLHLGSAAAAADFDSDLNIDDDDTAEFGAPQYDESNLQQAYEGETTEEDDEKGRVHALGGRGLTAGPPRTDGTGSGVGTATNSELLARSPWPRGPLHPPQQQGQQQQQASACIVESLNARIRELEILIRTCPRCLICLEPYKTPVTSVACWHTHCEVCWMRSLAAKKVCPQCQVITSAADLRKVYI